ncbi:MAG: DEAD/DEAH box helicase [Bacteroidales bacterium]|nr:DEAD/DEAH box helicase [Bacteroidales bacterium]
MDKKYTSFTKDVLTSMGFESLNEMQKEMSNSYNGNNNIVLLSPTGTGKTLAFLLPISYNLDKGENPQSMVIVPSRELAIQIERVFKSMNTQYRVCCCYGGHDLKKEKLTLDSNPELIVGTPGRILDHIKQGNINTETIHTLVLDEFDKSLELGFTDEMSEIAGKLQNINKRILTSATSAVEIPAYTGVKNPFTISFVKDNQDDNKLTIYQVDSPLNDKLDTLYNLICELGQGLKLVFCNYRESADRISEFLSSKGIENVNFHGGLEQVEREKAIAKFRNGSCNVLVSTDLASRGLDIPEIKDIIHYHFPVNKEAFIHRNGRTARMHSTGNAYVIKGPEEYLPDYIDENIPFFKLSEKTPLPAAPIWATIYIGKGKKDKISKGDIAGFLMQKGALKKEELGIIEVKDNHSFAAVKREKVKDLLKNIKDQKIKNIKTIFSLAR